MEVNPLYDVNNKTVRLAAELIMSFITGVNER
jgi:arginase family enzyme